LESIRKIIIASISKNGIIGNQNKMVWKIPEEIEHFKRTTIDNYILMGRKTFESIGKVLPNRTSLVLSKTKAENSKNLYYFDEIFKVFSFLKENSIPKIYIIGGEAVFLQTIDFADELILSFVKGIYSGDKVFPMNKLDDFELISSEEKTQFVINKFVRKQQISRNKK